MNPSTRHVTRGLCLKLFQIAGILDEMFLRPRPSNALPEMVSKDSIAQMPYPYPGKNAPATVTKLKLYKNEPDNDIRDAALNHLNDMLSIEHKVSRASMYQVRRPMDYTRHYS